MIFNTVEMFCYHLVVMNIILVSADLPEFVHRTERCPIPNNITDWRRSSKRLGCKHDILSKHPMEQKYVYHCLPTNYLNETVEFCGKSVPSDGGYCPVYTYEFGRNESPNFANCSGFLEGCPKDFFYSKEVFQHPACNDISKKERCYRSDPNCVTRQTKSSVQENMTKRDSGEVTRIMVAFSTGLVSIIILLIFIGLFILAKYMKGTGYTVIQKANGEIPEFLRVGLDDFLFTTGRKLNSDSVERLKSILSSKSTERKYRRRNKKLSNIKNGVELLKFMDRLYDFSMNIYILQGFLERINESDLVKNSVVFVEGKRSTCTDKYYKRPNLEDYRKVLFKLPDDDVQKITDGKISALRKNLMNLIDANFDDIVLRGISKGCVIIHTEMRELSLSKIEKLGIYAEFIFKKYHISKVYSKEHCLYPSQKSRQLYTEKNYPKEENSSTDLHRPGVIAQISELPDLPDSLNHINIAIMGAPHFSSTFVNMCRAALGSQTVIPTKAALTRKTSNSTAPLTVISSKTRSGRPIQIRILESEALQTIDSVVDFSTCANEASTCSRSLSELDGKIHCIVYALDPSEETSYGLSEIDYKNIKEYVQNQEIPKLLLLWTQNFSKVSFQDMFKRRVQVCDEFQLPLRLILPAYDPLSSETHTNEALQSLLYMINRAIKYASEKSQ